MEKPILEITLRKYEPPSNNFERNLKLFLLSLGLIRPGDKNPLIEKIFAELLKEKEVTVSYLSKKLGKSESAIRYHLKRLKELKILEGSRRYRIYEGDLVLAFFAFKKYVLGEVLERIEEYAKALT